MESVEQMMRRLRDEAQRKLLDIVRPLRRPRKNSVTPAGSFRFGKSRNLPCPCGSGKKFKACHAQGVGTSLKYVTLKREAG
jgi:uncharacterized protein YecA (UPF0149 family)